MDMIDMLDRSLCKAGEVLDNIEPQTRAQPSVCDRWTVGELSNHMIGALNLLGRVSIGDRPAPEEFDPQRLATSPAPDGDNGGPALRRVAGELLAAWRAPTAFDGTRHMPAGEVPPAVVLSLQLMEATIHGYDLACSTGQPYVIDDDVADALHGFSTQAFTEDTRASGLIGPEVPVDRDRPTAERLLGFMGRAPH